MNRMMEKTHIGVAIIGHVDHGKSTLAGRLLFDSDQIDPYIIERYKKKAAAIGKKSFEFAWVMDTLPEERKRGLTIKTQIRDLYTDKYFLSIIDAPGHEDFIKNMILGARQADVAVLVVSANEGVQVQTREHVYIAQSLGINQMLVVINKMDITTPPYSQTRYEQVVKDVDNLMKTAECTEYAFVPASAFVGDNVVIPSENLAWYEGDTVFEMLDMFEIPKRQTDLLLRWPIQDKFKVRGIGYIPAGKVEAGVIRPDDMIVFMPSNKRAQVKTIEMHKKRIERGIPGDNIGVDIRAIDGWSLKDWIKRGDVAGHVDSPPTVAKRFTARIVIFSADEIYGKEGKEEAREEKRYYPPKIKVGFSPSIHCHTARVTCRVVELLAKINGSSGDVVERSPKYIRDGDSAVAVFEPEKPLVIEKASDFPKLGRFAIRDSNRTIGAGMCLDMEKKEF
jgi:elongation factor 1-alpha